MATENAPDNGQISLAIIGAGVASLCLARGLLKYPQISVCVYEARHDIGNDGSGFGIGANRQRAMQLIDSDLIACLERAGGVEMVPQVRFMMATGPHAREHISDHYAEPPQKTVRRSRFLTELRKTLLEGILQTGTRLTAIEGPINGDGKVRLVFERASDIFVDGMVGCDGITSIVRRYVLGPDHPALEAQWRSSFNTRIVIPMTEAVPIFGQDYCNLMTQHGFIGQDEFCLTGIEDDGNAMQVIAGFRGEKPVSEVFGKPYVEVEKSFWTKRLGGWGWIGQNICQVVERQEKVFAGSGRSHNATPTYSTGRLCIAGDAARTFSPARGAGAEQSMEDALLLYSVLGCIEKATDVQGAFQVYDCVRRPRRELVAEESQVAGMLNTGQHPDVGIDVDKLRKAIEGYSDWIYDHDLEAVVAQAKRLMSS